MPAAARLPQATNNCANRFRSSAVIGIWR